MMSSGGVVARQGKVGCQGRVSRVNGVNEAINDINEAVNVGKGKQNQLGDEGEGELQGTRVRILKILLVSTCQCLQFVTLGFGRFLDFRFQLLLLPADFLRTDKARNTTAKVFCDLYNKESDTTTTASMESGVPDNNINNLLTL